VKIEIARNSGFTNPVKSFSSGTDSREVELSTGDYTGGLSAERIRAFLPGFQ
jgi:hypothetical protein